MTILKTILKESSSGKTYPVVMSTDYQDIMFGYDVYDLPKDKFDYYHEIVGQYVHDSHVICEGSSKAYRAKNQSLYKELVLKEKVLKNDFASVLVEISQLVKQHRQNELDLEEERQRIEEDELMEVANEK